MKLQLTPFLHGRAIIDGVVSQESTPVPEEAGRLVDASKQCLGRCVTARRCRENTGDFCDRINALFGVC